MKLDLRQLSLFPAIAAALFACALSREEERTSTPAPASPPSTTIKAEDNAPGVDSSEVQRTSTEETSADQARGQPAEEPPADPAPPPAKTPAAGTARGPTFPVRAEENAIAGRGKLGGGAGVPESNKSQPTGGTSAGTGGENAPSSQSSLAAPITPSNRPKEAEKKKEERGGAEGDAPDFSEHDVLRPRFDEMYFRHFGVNPTIETTEQSLSTFSVDVDTAAYGVARAYLTAGNMPPEAAIRVEEFINSFDYGYESPTDFAFSIQAEVFPSLNRHGYHVLHVGLKGKEVTKAARKPANLVFVIDISGSMARGNRLRLVKRSLRALVESLDERDTIGVVVYGDRARTALSMTNANERERILAAIDGLRPEGSTNVQAGLEMGYAMAADHLLAGGINRVILCSDGVANNGIRDADDIFNRVRSRAERGITISTFGFGMGHYNDVLMERLADVGNGNYAYVDRFAAAKKAFQDQLVGTLQVIAKDVKIQVELDRRTVARYRLLGYENRQLAREDFADDRVDAGEIGAGHSVTAIYEIKFHAPPTGDFGNIRVRYKEPDGSRSQLVERPLPARIVHQSAANLSSPTRISLVAAGFAEKLRGSYWARNLSYDQILGLYEGIRPAWKNRSDIAELGSLIRTAAALDRRIDKFERDLPLAQMDFDHVPILR